MKPEDDFGWDEWSVLISAAVLALFIGAVVELCRLPGRLWRAIQ